MLLFGHIGITTGVARAGDIFLSMARPDSNQESNFGSKVDPVIGKRRLDFYPLRSRIKSRVGSIDYRMALLGSLLPDIVDKPIFLLMASNVSLSGRNYAHTLLFNLALLISGLVVIRYRKSWLLIISLSSFMHLILDQMWNSPAALLWPLLGPLPGRETVGWLSNIFRGLFSRPEVYIPEIIGLVIVLLFAYRLTMRKRVIGFLKDGAIG